MEAREQAFYFMQAVMSVEIPFFQRGYVWNEDNWEELIENLLDDNQSHFLGSIILKQQQVATGQVPRCYVIDGQQRLTTLSILLRACYDSLPLATYSTQVQANVTAMLEQILFFKEKQLSEKKEIKIKHSRIDASDYGKVVRGEMKEQLESIILDSEAKLKSNSSSHILQCYKYFMNYFKDKPDTCERLWELLISENNRMIVKIDLKAEENEQAIFDTVNSAGVRLTCYDTIKNALFQKAMENTKNQQEEQSVIDLYANSWEKMFSESNETVEFWNAERQLGRLMRDNQEVLLHAVALIKGFFDPEKNKISDLAQLYKAYIIGFDNVSLFKFINEIIEYAQIYKVYFITFDKSTYFTYSEQVKRLFHILSICEISTLHPYILKLFKDYNVQVNQPYPKEFLDELYLIEKYVMRHCICRVSMKNFNKDCASLIKGRTTVSKLLEEKKNELSDDIIKLKLKDISSNKIGSLVLFWIELKRRENDSKIQIKELKYNYSLEHIMPQKWQEHWDVTKLPVIDIKTSMEEQDIKEANKIRAAVIYQLGNMTLLNSSLNTSLRNYEFERKVLGEGRKKGIKDYADLEVAKEIVKVYEQDKKWNELSIELRTQELSNEFLELW